jgi:hypothetical protein
LSKKDAKPAKRIVYNDKRKELMSIIQSSFNPYDQSNLSSAYKPLEYTFTLILGLEKAATTDGIAKKPPLMTKRSTYLEKDWQIKFRVLVVGRKKIRKAKASLSDHI